jgi:hypothetical protein
MGYNAFYLQEHLGAQYAMLRHGLWFLILFSSACVAGSAAQHTLDQMTAEKPGSPYHWVSENAYGGTVLTRALLGKPDRTVADDRTKADVLKNIGGYEEKAGGDAQPKVLEVRRLPKVGNEYNEVWIVARGKERIVYTVGLTPSPEGGVDLRIQGPWD